MVRRCVTTRVVVVVPAREKKGYTQRWIRYPGGESGRGREKQTNLFLSNRERNATSSRFPFRPKSVFRIFLNDTFYSLRKPAR
jgi:hypothetical protein